MDEDVFPNPTAFIPDRWLSQTNKTYLDSSEVIPDMNQDKITIANFPDIIFSIGAHSCLGRSMAFLILSVMIAMIVNEFELHLDEGTEITSDGYLPSIIELTLKPKNSLQIQFEKRENHFK